MFADRIHRIQPSATLAMTSKAAELRAKGVDVINLSVGEPDFPTPKNIQTAAIKAMDDGFTRYTPGAGMMALRQAAADKMKRDNNLDYDPKEIIVFNDELKEFQLLSDVSASYVEYSVPKNE